MRILKKLKQTTPSSLDAQISEANALAEAWLILGDETKALREFEPLAAKAKRQKRKSTGVYLLGLADSFRKEQGLVMQRPPSVEAEYARARRAILSGDMKVARRSVAQAQAALTATSGWEKNVFMLWVEVGKPDAARKLWRSLPKSKRAEFTSEQLVQVGLRTDAFALIQTRGKAALSELTRSEWNINSPAADVREAVDGFLLLGKRPQATALFEAAVARFDAGGLDDKGFASTGAYLALAQVAFALQGAESARVFIERAWGCAGKYRKMVSRNVAETYAAIGDVDAALALLGPKAPVELLAQTLSRAKRFRELKALLKKVKAPEIAAKVAWFCVPNE